MVISQYQQQSKAKPTLALIHGWGVNHKVFSSIEPELAEKFDLLLIDLPGFGNQVQQSIAEYDLESLANVVAEQVPDNAIVCGWSLGGLVALKMAILAPKRYKAIGLIASSPRFVETDNWRGIKPSVLTQFAAELAKNIEQTIARFLAIQAMGAENARSDIKQLKAQLSTMPAPSSQALYAGLDILQDTDLRDQLKSIEIPIKGIFGKLDSLVPYASVQALAGQSCFSHLAIIEKASHAPFVSHKEAFLSHFFDMFEN
ncbi:pimeloyl-ACP methyl ester esterase BioH [Flocculibacter collagenilyticus]|uniref:pimeloyl-ACP methyl ester esterase BioH n=1 Tax=Flocculibacter collagenilyticus TaxID=2744479 RepID=UPI0018F602E5|nr:pimeloyl-ACP methyl ester esterase BioH [Flocculibacter collagenilyticus]